MEPIVQGIKLFLKDTFNGQYILIDEEQYCVVRLTQFGRSLIKMRNNKGPKKDPCGTPEFKSMGSEEVPLAKTDWVLSAR